MEEKLMGICLIFLNIKTELQKTREMTDAGVR